MGQRGNVAVVCWGLRTSRGGPWEPFVSPVLIRDVDQKDGSPVNEKIAAYASLCVHVHVQAASMHISNKYINI